jgi:hypothetical protein
VQTPARLARKIFDSRLKLSGWPRQIAANGHFMQVTEQKKSLAAAFALGQVNQ